MDCKSFYGARQRTYLALVPENSQDSDGELSDDDPIEDPDFQPNFADDSDESCFDVSLDEDAPSTSRSNKLFDNTLPNHNTAKAFCCVL